MTSAEDVKAKNIMSSKSSEYRRKVEQVLWREVKEREED